MGWVAFGVSDSHIGLLKTTEFAYAYLAPNTGVWDDYVIMDARVAETESPNPPSLSPKQLVQRKDDKTYKLGDTGLDGQTMSYVHFSRSTRSDLGPDFDINRVGETNLILAWGRGDAGNYVSTKKVF